MEWSVVEWSLSLAENRTKIVTTLDIILTRILTPRPWEGRGAERESWVEVWYGAGEESRPPVPWGRTPQGQAAKQSDGRIIQAQLERIRA